jgi:hypothetical protein
VVVSFIGGGNRRKPPTCRKVYGGISSLFFSMFYSFIADWFNLENPSAEITEDEYRLLSIWDGMTELLPERIDGR